MDLYLRVRFSCHVDGISKIGAELLFEVFSQRYERGSTLGLEWRRFVIPIVEIASYVD